VEPIRERIKDFMLRYGRVLAVAVLLVGLAGCGEAPGDYSYANANAHDSSGIVAEPRLVPKPKTCSDYANAHEILIDEQAGKLTKADKQWLDMDGDGRYCEEPGVEWKGERSQAE
jgi:hypothetical protein